MKIAQIAPLYESVPPQAYGGTERVVSYLTEALIAQGHAVTLFASGDSHTAGELVPVLPRPLGLNGSRYEAQAWHTVLLDRVFEQASRFDVLHFHTDGIHYPLARRCAVPSLTTLHGRLDLPGLGPLHAQFPTLPLVSISGSQRRPQPQANWCAIVPHGLPQDLYRLHENPGGHFAFIGRASPEKRLDRAIEIARACRTPLRIAATVHEADREYFERCIRPLLADPLIEFVGEIGEADKNEFLGNARALLFPIDWPEPFGLVMIEALACGTPVIAWDCGSVPEVIQHGVTGYVVRNMAEAIDAAGRIDAIDRRRCRAAFERRYTADRMAERYVRVYQALIETRAGCGDDGAPPHPPGAPLPRAAQLESEGGQ